MLWAVEWLFTTLAGSRPIPGSRGTLLVACHPYHGSPVHLPGGTTVHAGDRVAEIHFWNRRISARAAADPDPMKGTWRFIADFRHDLRALARALGSGEFGAGVVAVFGVSPLALGAPRFGFTLRPLRPGFRRRVLTAWQDLLRRAFAARAAPHPPGTETTESWISAADLQRLYGDPAPAHPPGGRSDPVP